MPNFSLDVKKCPGAACGTLRLFIAWFFGWNRIHSGGTLSESVPPEKLNGLGHFWESLLTHPSVHPLLSQSTHPSIYPLLSQSNILLSIHFSHSPTSFYSSTSLTVDTSIYSSTSHSLTHPSSTYLTIYTILRCIHFSHSQYILVFTHFTQLTHPSIHPLLSVLYSYVYSSTSLTIQHPSMHPLLSQFFIHKSIHPLLSQFSIHTSIHPLLSQFSIHTSIHPLLSQSTILLCIHFSHSQRILLFIHFTQLTHPPIHPPLTHTWF